MSHVSSLSSLQLFGVIQCSKAAIGNPGSTTAVLRAPPGSVDSHEKVCHGAPVLRFPTSLLGVCDRFREAINRIETVPPTFVPWLVSGRKVTLSGGGREARYEHRGQHGGIRGECRADIASKEVRRKFVQKASDRNTFVYCHCEPVGIRSQHPDDDRPCSDV